MRPDILANRDADSLASVLDHRHRSGRLEVTILVEHIVSRQQAFAGRSLDLAVYAKHRGVVTMPTVFIGVGDHGADQRRHIFNRFQNLIHRLLGVAH